MTQPDTSRPRPLRIIAAIAAVATLAVAGLPTFGVPLSAAQASWLVGAVGVLAATAVALIGETHVTPLISPRTNDGTPLEPAKAPDGPTGYAPPL